MIRFRRISLSGRCLRNFSFDHLAAVIAVLREIMNEIQTVRSLPSMLTKTRENFVRVQVIRIDHLADLTMNFVQVARVVLAQMVRPTVVRFCLRKVSV